MNSAANYEMPRYIKIEMGTIFPDLMTLSTITKKELEDVKFDESNIPAKHFAMRFWKNYPDCLYADNEETTGDEGSGEKVKPYRYNSRRSSNSQDPVVVNKPSDEDREFWYFTDDKGFMYLFELNGIISHLKIKKSQGISQMNNYDPLKKVLKNKNEVFANAEEMEEYFIERKLVNNGLMEFKMDKTFHLTQSYDEETKLMIDINSRLLWKMNFKIHHEALTQIKVISMPNKIILTWAASYVIRIWSLFGKNLWILNIEYPLPYKWDIQINRFYRRKMKYLEAVKIKQKFEKKTQNTRNTTLNAPSKTLKPVKPSLEKWMNLQTFKNLVNENKDDPSGSISLRKIDARSNLRQEEKKTKAHLQSELFQNASEFRVKLEDGCREELAKDTNGNSISGKMPKYLVSFDGPEADANCTVVRVDDNAHNSGAVAGNTKAPRDNFQNKGLWDGAFEALNAPYLPQPAMAEKMKDWEEDFDRSFNELKILKSNKEKVKKKNEIKKANFQKRAGVFMSSEDFQSMME